MRWLYKSVGATLLNERVYFHKYQHNPKSGTYLYTEKLQRSRWLSNTTIFSVAYLGSVLCEVNLWTQSPQLTSFKAFHLLWKLNWKPYDHQFEVAACIIHFKTCTTVTLSYSILRKFVVVMIGCSVSTNVGAARLRRLTFLLPPGGWSGWTTRTATWETQLESGVHRKPERVGSPWAYRAEHFYMILTQRQGRLGWTLLVDSKCIAEINCCAPVKLLEPR